MTSPIYNPQWFGPLVKDAVALVNEIVHKLKTNQTIGAGAVANAFTKILEKHAPKETPIAPIPKPTPVAGIKEMVVAPPVVTPEPESPNTEVPPSRLAAIKAIISKESIRLNALCQRLDAPEVEILAIINDPKNGLKKAKAGWISAV